MVIQSVGATQICLLYVYGLGVNLKDEIKGTDKNEAKRRVIEIAQSVLKKIGEPTEYDPAWDCRDLF